MKRAVTFAVLAMTLSACSEPLEFADWMIPVPEGTPVRQYAPVPAAARSERIELIEDLVIGERAGDDNYMLYNARSVLAGPEGRIYVLDSGNSRLQVFDAEGEYIATMGREGQGPGEFSGANAMVIAGDRLLVKDFRNRRYSVWALDGEHIGEVSYPAGPSPLSLRGFTDGTMVGRLMARDENENAFDSAGTPHYQLFLYDLDGNAIHEIQDFPRPNLPVITRSTETSAMFMSLRVPSPTASFVATAGGAIYTSLSEEYQVYALNKDATMRWALRVAWDRVPITEDEIVSALERARERLPDVSRSEVNWPESRPALSYLNVDGHGHLYVFPYPESTEAASAEEVAVDVYSAAGEHLFSGSMPRVRWTDAEGDFVYAAESDDDTGEERIIRHRLIEPWEQS